MAKMLFTRLTLFSVLAWTCSAGPISRTFAVSSGVSATETTASVSPAGSIDLETPSVKQDDGVTVTPVTPPWLLSSSTSLSIVTPSTTGYAVYLTHTGEADSSSVTSLNTDRTIPVVIYPSAATPTELSSTSVSVITPSTPGYAVYLTVYHHTDSDTSSPTSSEHLTTPITVFDGTTLGASPTSSSVPTTRAPSSTQVNSTTSVKTSTSSHIPGDHATTDTKPLVSTHSPSMDTVHPDQTGITHSSKTRKPTSSTPESTGQAKGPSSSNSSPSEHPDTTTASSAANISASSSSTAQATHLTVGMIVPLSDPNTSTGDSFEATPTPTTAAGTSEAIGAQNAYTTEVVVVPKGGGSPITTKYIDVTSSKTTHKTTSTSSETTKSTSSTSTSTTTHRTETVTVHATTTQKVTVTISGPTVTVTSTPTSESTTPATSKSTSTTRTTTSEKEKTVTIQSTTTASVTVSVPGPTVTLIPSTSSQSLSSSTPTPTDTGGVTVIPVTPSGFITVTVTTTVTVTAPQRETLI